MRLTDLQEDFLEHRQALADSPHTIARLESTIKLFCQWLEQVEGETDIEGLRAEHLHAYQCYLANARSRRGGMMAPATINARIKGVVAMLRFAFLRNYTRRDLSIELSYIKEPDRLPQVLKHEQILMLLANVDTSTMTGLRHAAAIEVSYSTGLRISELCSLELDDVDYLTAEVMVRHGKGKKERKVAIGQKALAALKRYVDVARTYFANEHSGRSIFLGHGGRSMCQSSFRQTLRQLAKDAGIEDQVTPHVFRRTCTSEMIKGNANLYAVKNQLGHESLNTLKHYTRLHIEDLKDAHRRCHPREQDEV